MITERYLDVPYLYNGRTWKGADCYGLLILWFKNELGIDLIDYNHGTEHWSALDSNIMLANAYREFEKVTEGDARKHDVVVLNNGGVPHCGVMVDGKHFLHTLERIGPATSKISTWRDRIVGFYRHKSFIEGQNDHQACSESV